jgi:uncharacterized membrane protein YqjE
MSLPTTPGAQPDDGLIEHLRRLVASFAAYASARLQLAGLESKEASWHYLKALIWLFAAVLACMFGYIFACVGCVFIIHTWLGISWIWILLAAGIVHLVFAAIAIFIVRAMISAPMFTATITEFKKDQSWLNTQNPTKNPH